MSFDFSQQPSSDTSFGSSWPYVAGGCLLAVLLGALSLAWFARNWRVPSDGSMYMLHARTLLGGGGYVSLGAAPQTVRGPVFPGTLAVLMAVLGYGVGHLAWAVRLLALLNPVLTVLVFARIGGWRVGTLAGALVALFGLTSRLPDAFNIDAFLLTVVLVAILVLLLAAEHTGPALSFCAGLLFGLSLLTKETVFVLAPLGAFVGVLYRRPVRWAAAYYLGVAAVSAPWWIWVWWVSGEVYLLGRLPGGALVLALVALAVLGAGAAVTVRARVLARPWVLRNRLHIAWLALAVWSAAFTAFGLSTARSISIPSAWEYLAGQVLRDVALWPLVPFGAGYAVWRARRGHKGWSICVAFLLAWVPVALLVLVSEFRTRQWMLPQVLLYGCVAGMVVEAVSYARYADPRRKAVGWTLAGLISLLLLATGINQADALLTERLRLAEKDPYNQVNRSEQRMAQWVGRRVPRGEVILTTWLYSYQLAYDDAGKHVWVPLARDCVYLGQPFMDAAKICGPDTRPPESLELAAPIMWLELSPDCRGFSTSVRSIRGQMDRSGARYLMLTETRTPGQAGTQSWRDYLTASGFRPLFGTYLSRGPTVTEIQGLVLLTRTFDAAARQPGTMSAESVLNLHNCARSLYGATYRDVIRRLFPYGISILDPSPQRAKAQQVVDAIFASP